MSDTLPIIPSIQPLNSRALDDKVYEIHWNPVWEPSEEDIPFTPPGVSVQMYSSDMEDVSPITTDESVATSGEIPTATEATPVRSTPLGERLPKRYKALRDIMSSRTPSTSSIWSHTVAPTSESFIPQIHNVSVTSIPTIPMVCVASLTPVVSASSVMATAHSGPSAPRPEVVDPTLNVPLSFGSIPAGGPYDQYLQTIQYNYVDPDRHHLHLGRPLPSQLAVEVTVPLSVAWGTTTYHGGQASPAHLQGPPNQGQPSYMQTSQGQQYYGQSYPGQPGGPQGQPFQGQPSASGDPSFTYFSQPSGNPRQPYIQQGQPGAQQGYPSLWMPSRMAHTN